MINTHAFNWARQSSLLLTGFMLVFPFVTHAQSAAPKADKSLFPTPTESQQRAELLFEVLLGELNAQMNEPGAGYSLILDAARKSGDARLYKRAVEIALQAKSGPSALEAARAWKQAFPESRPANRFVLQVLIAMNQINEILEPLQTELKLTPAKELPGVISSLPSQLAQASNKKMSLAVVEEALKPYLNANDTSLASWIALGWIRLSNNELTTSEQAATRALQINPQSLEAGFVALELFNRDHAPAGALIQKILLAQPEASFRLNWTRSLLEKQRASEALDQLELINKNSPKMLEAWLLKGGVLFEQNKNELSQSALQRYLEIANESDANTPQAKRGKSQAYAILAQIAIQNKDDKAAESLLAKIDDPQALVSAQTERARILARKGQLKEARQLVSQLPSNTAQARKQRTMVEAQLLRDFNDFDEAYRVLNTALAATPLEHDIAYELAMLCEKMQRLDEMEKLLRNIIAQKPDYHHAYNALGYSLADRGIRLQEARSLIVKALEFAPEDPFITDSLGWVEFRMGNSKEALAILTRAYKTRPDPEIAAHLGEVHWSLGQRDQALQVWREGLKLDPKHQALLDAIKRLKAPI